MTERSKSTGVIEGWNRTCPGCGTNDGSAVRRVAFFPTFECKECGFVWDGSEAELLFLVKAPDPNAMTDDEIAAFVAVLIERAARDG